MNLNMEPFKSVPTPSTSKESESTSTLSNSPTVPSGPVQPTPSDTPTVTASTSMPATSRSHKDAITYSLEMCLRAKDTTPGIGSRHITWYLPPTSRLSTRQPQLPSTVHLNGHLACSEDCHPCQQDQEISVDLPEPWLSSLFIPREFQRLQLSPARLQAIATATDIHELGCAITRYPQEWQKRFKNSTATHFVLQGGVGGRLVPNPHQTIRPPVVGLHKPKEWDKAVLIWKMMKKALSKGYMEHVPSQEKHQDQLWNGTIVKEIYGKIFLIEKKDPNDDPRVLLDSKASGWNDSQVKRTHKMMDIRDVKGRIKPGDYLGMWDYSNWYHQVTKAMALRRGTRVRVLNTDTGAVLRLQYASLAQGESWSVILSDIMNETPMKWLELHTGLRRVSKVDDNLLAAATKEEFAAQAFAVLWTLSALGFVFKATKCRFNFSHRVEFHGFVICSVVMVVSMPVNKLIKIAELTLVMKRKLLSNREWVTPTEVAKVLGTLVSTKEGVEEATLNTSSLNRLLNYLKRRKHFTWTQQYAVSRIPLEIKQSAITELEIWHTVQPPLQVHHREYLSQTAYQDSCRRRQHSCQRSCHTTKEAVHLQDSQQMKQKKISSTTVTKSGMNNKRTTASIPQQNAGKSSNTAKNSEISTASPKPNGFKATKQSSRTTSENACATLSLQKVDGTLTARTILSENLRNQWQIKETSFPWNGSAFFQQDSGNIAQTDACDHSWGMTMKASTTHPELYATRVWTVKEAKTHITLKETMATAMGAIEVMTIRQLTNTTLTMETDNMCSRKYNNGGGRLDHLNKAVQEMIALARALNVKVSVRYKPGIDMEADEPSRLVLNFREWEINPAAIKILEHYFGQIKVDMFAQPWNNTKKRYVTWTVSDTKALAYDAMAQDWALMEQTFGLLYMFPPRSDRLMWRIFQKIRQDNVQQVLLVMPAHLNHHMHTAMSMAISMPVFFKSDKRLLLQPKAYTTSEEDISAGLSTKDKSWFKSPANAILIGVTMSANVKTVLAFRHGLLRRTATATPKRMADTLTRRTGLWSVKLESAKTVIQYCSAAILSSTY